jgi:TPP-dependent pyruvate/acetoin dehydrogenase alpha subunit
MGGVGFPPATTQKNDPAPAWENPLMPNKRLRELYTAMVELSLLEGKIAGLQTRKKTSQLRLHFGEEGCVVSTIMSLKPGDLTGESEPSIAPEFLRGTTKLTALLKRTKPPATRPSPELPPISDTATRLNLTIGAALALAVTKKGSLTVAYIHAGDLTSQQWKPILKLAATQIAPILFVVLPHPTKIDKPGQLGLTSTSCGVPGIPVDAADPVALYRVAQESMLRIRAGGGPVLMECIPFQIPGKRAESTDPILTMQQFMLPRGVATEVWFNQVATRFAARLKTAAK